MGICIANAYSHHLMQYRIEDIIEYLTAHYTEYTFTIREYASPLGEYSNEAVVFYPLISDTVGVIIETDPFNPTIYYTKTELLATLARLEEKSLRIGHILKKASSDFDAKIQLGHLSIDDSQK